MSNILIIKHGSLGDLIQANGAIKDIKNFYSNRKVFLLTTQPYSIFMSLIAPLDWIKSPNEPCFIINIFDIINSEYI